MANSEDRNEGSLPERIEDAYKTRREAGSSEETSFKSGFTRKSSTGENASNDRAPRSQDGFGRKEGGFRGRDDRNEGGGWGKRRDDDRGENRGERGSFNRNRDDRPNFRNDREERGGGGFNREGRDADRPFSRNRDERPSFRGDRDERGGGGFNRDRGGDRPSFRSDRDNRSSDRPFRRDRDDRGFGNRDFRKDSNEPPIEKSGDKLYMRVYEGGDKPPRSDRDDRPSFRGDREERGGGGFNRDRGGDRPSFRDDRGGDRPFRRDRDDRGGDRPSFRGDREERGGGGFNRDRGGDRPSFRDDRGGDRPFRRDRDERGGDRPSFRGDREERGGGGFNRDDRGGDRPFRRDRDERGGDRPSFRGDRDERGGGSFNREDRGGDRPFRRDRDDRPSFRSERNERGGTYEAKKPVQQPPVYDREIFMNKQAAEGEGQEELIRLNRFIANSGLCSRRMADEYIEKGQITVNGEVVTTLGMKVRKFKDEVAHNGKLLFPEKRVYVLLNKPKGFITTMEDEHDRRTVMELVEDACEERIYPVGRLDRETTGLLLFTNDGELATELMHPSGRVQKIYLVELDKPISEEDFDSIIYRKVELEDGPIDLDGISIVSDDRTRLGVELHSGRNRIVRRIFERFGYEVIKLDRTVYAGLTKLDLPRGRWRYLTQQEVVNLKHYQKRSIPETEAIKIE